jgi:hypothetical protein
MANEADLWTVDTEKAQKRSEFTLKYGQKELAIS